MLEREDVIRIVQSMIRDQLRIQLNCNPWGELHVGVTLNGIPVDRASVELRIPSPDADG